MKKFTKIMGIAAAIFLAVGIGFSAAGVAMGASLENLDAVQELKTKYMELKNEVWEDDWHDDWEDDWHEDDWHEHEHTAENSSYTTGKGNGSYEFNDMNEIDVELKYDTFVVEEHEQDYYLVEVENDPDGDIKVWNEGTELKIEGKNTRKDGRTVTLYCPRNTSLLKFSADVDAGVINVGHDIHADEIEFQVGAGQFTNEGIIEATKFDAEVGVGSAEIKNLSSDNISAECGTGSMKLDMTGAQDDYRYKLECALGAICIGNNTYSSLNREEIINNDGASGIMELECGLGEITVNFQQ